MAEWHGRSVRKVSGGRYRDYRKKRRYEWGTELLNTHVGPLKTKSIRGYGGNKKIKVLSADHIVIYDPKHKGLKKVKIVTVKENRADRHFVQRNILTKGAIVQTEIGLAKITSRPGQHGTINGVLIE